MKEISLFKFKLFSLTLFCLFLASCEEMELCYYDDDFGDSGNNDIVYVYSAENNCYFDSTSSYTSTSQSITMQECIKKTSLSTINSEDNYANELKNEFSAITKINGKNTTSANCSDIDPQTKTNIYEGNDDAEANAARSVIYSKCVEYCSEQCSTDSTEMSDKWVAANIKQDNNYLGIKLKDDSYVYITVSGSIVLGNTNSTPTVKYKKYGVEEIDYSTQITNSNSTNLFLDYNTSIINTDFNGLDNFSNRTVISLIKAKSDLILTESSEDKYKYQQPIYNNFKCTYSESSESNIQDISNCEFDFTSIKNATEQNKLNLSNYYNNNYKNIIFDNDYFKYSNNILNDILLVDSESGNFNLSDTIDKNTIKRITKDQEITYTPFDGGSEQLIGYIWDNSKNSITFTTNNAVKIAIKYIGNVANSINTACNISAKVTNYYEYDNKNKTIKNIEKEYNNITYNISNNNGKNKWEVLKTQSDGKNIEIVFNQFSTTNKSINSKITLTLEGTNNICNKGMLIMPIPLKDYEVNKTGLAFFSFPNATPEENNIKFNIINPNVISTNNLENNELRISEFYEYEGKPNTFGVLQNNASTFKEVEILNSSNINDIDNNIFTSSLLNKSIFVRKGQIIRFDYSNWFNFNDSEIILKKINGINNSGNTIKINKPTGLNLFIKERPAYFCIGSIKESVSKRSKCLSISENAKYETIDLSNSNQIGECYIPNDDCMASINLVKEYYSIDNTANNCSRSQEVINNMNATEKKLSELWENINNDYELALNLINSGESEYNNIKLSCYNDIIKKIYTKALECSNSLSRNSNNFRIYEGKSNNNNEIKYSEYKTNRFLNKSVDDLYKNKNTNDAKNYNKETIELLNTFFVITDTYKNTDSNSSTKTSLFKYYNIVCEEDSNSSSMCLTTDNMPQCYNLDNYNGSINGFVKRTGENVSNNLDSGYTQTYGTMKEDDGILGAEKLNSFNGLSGLIKNFVEESDTNGLSSNFSRIKYDGTIYSNDNGFLSVYILNYIKGETELTGNNNLSREERIKNSFISHTATNNNIILQMQIEAKTVYQNGANLAVMVAESNKKIDGTISTDFTATYYNDNNGVYYYSKGNKIRSTEGIGHIDLVKYDQDGKFNNNSPYTFNSSGELIKNTTGTLGIDFSEYSDFINNNNSKTQKNIFFRIADIDNNVDNNEGKYKITIKEYNNTQSGIISYFRDFFNNVLNFIDGAYVKIARNKVLKTYVPCTSETSNDGSCYIYNENEVQNNGNTCQQGKSDCYKSCLALDITQECVSLYNGKGFVKGIYETFINDPLYVFILKISLALSITWYGFGYFFGLTNFKQSDIIMKIIRVSFIYFIVSPSGWDFFNQYVIKFFKDGIDSVLFLIAGSFEGDLSSELLRAVTSKDYSDKSVLFTSAFTNLEMIFSNSVFNKMLGLAFSGWIGLVYLYLVFVTVINYVVAVITSIIIYLSAQVYMSLTFCFFPLVVLFMLFEKTKKTFDNWISILTGLVGQQLFLVVTLSFFNLLISNFIKNTFSYTVCWLSIFNMNIGGIPLALIQFWKIPGTSMSSSGINTMNEGMPSFYSIITFYMIGVLMNKFLTEMVSMGNSIFGGKISATGGVAGQLTKGVDVISNKVKDGMKNTGKTFYTEMADRLGGKAIKEYGKGQVKEMTDRRNKRKQHFNNVKTETDKNMENYKNSEEFRNKKDKIEDKSREKAMQQYSEKYEKSVFGGNGKEYTEDDRLFDNEIYSGNTVRINELRNKENYNDITKKERTELRELEKQNRNIEDKRNYSANSKTIKNLEAIQSEQLTEEEKSQLETARNANKNIVGRQYGSEIDKTARSESDKEVKEHLKYKQQEFAYNNERESALKSYSDDAKKAFLHSGGTEDYFAEHKDDITAFYAESRGLIGKKPKEEKEEELEATESTDSNIDRTDNPENVEQQTIQL